MFVINIPLRLKGGMPMPSELEKNEVRKEQKAQYKKQQERAMKEELREEMQQAC